jgi:hypothetical protein
MFYQQYNDSYCTQGVRDPTSKLFVSEKLCTWYADPATGRKYKVTVGYKFNEKILEAAENRLLRSPEYEEWEEKKKVLIQLFSQELASGSHQMFPTVTALEFHTTDDGQLQWRVFEDTNEVIALVSADEIPKCVPRIEVSELTELEELTGVCIYTAKYNGVMCVVKIHEDPDQNDTFPAELKARTRLANAPHISRLIGIVIQDSPADGKSYVQAMVLEYGAKGAIKHLLSCSEPPVEPTRKKRWAAQIAH